MRRWHGAHGQAARVAKQSATYRIARPGKVLHTDHELSSLLLLLILARATHGDAVALVMKKVMGLEFRQRVCGGRSGRGDRGRPGAI